MQKLMEFEKKHLGKQIYNFDIGDTVDVHFKIKEESKMRVQIFSGVVIAKKGSGMGRNFTVRRISYGEGVERKFPFNSPLLVKVHVVKKGKVRRAKLYYLRGKEGKKATKVRDKIDQTTESKS